MCTVTFIPVQGKLFITHNRDENSLRAKALVPQEYNIAGHKLLFPRDAAAGGTWIALNENGAVGVLLNGGFVKHIAKPPYRKSRGIIFLEILATQDILLSYKKTDLSGIEPFTLLLSFDDSLHECRWDGERKHIKQLNNKQKHIWSSVTLYDEEIVKRRREWFREWILDHPTPGQEEIIQFHLSGGEGDEHNDLRMNRNGEMLTLSITGIEISQEKAIMKYLDLQHNSIHVNEFLFTKAVIEK